MFDINYYEGPDGIKPVERFIDSLDPKMKAKVFGRLELLEEYGPCLGMPFSRHVEGGIYELRTVQGNNNVRILYFFVVGRLIVMTNGFIKKNRKTPRKEIERAKKYRNEWSQRNG